MAALIAAAMMLAGCDQLTGMEDADGAANQGQMKVLLTDAPFPADIVEEANVTISKVTAVSEERGRFVLSEEEQSFNLLDYQNGVTTALTDLEDLPSGEYQQVRLKVADASIVLNEEYNNEEYDVKVPSGRIKVLLPDDFEVVADEEVELTLDFDAGKSFVLKGNADTPAGIKGFNLKPVVKPVGWKYGDREEQEISGAIEEINLEDGYVVISGTQYNFDSETVLEGFDSFEALVEGDEIEIEFVQNGDSYWALKIEPEEDDNEGEGDDDEEEQETSEEEGAVDEIGDTYLVVDGVRYEVNDGTEYEGVDGLSGLTTDSSVAIEYVEQDGNRVATEIEVASSDDDTEENEGESETSDDTDDGGTESRVDRG